MKPLIISLSVDGRERYSEKVKGLEQSLIPFKDEFDVRIYKEFPDWVTPHSEVPYKFKYDLIKKAVGDGWKKIFWFDSSMRVLKNPFGLLNNSENGVVAFHNIGHNLYPRYLSDVAETNLSIYPNDITKVESTWGGALGFDFNMSLPYWLMVELTRQIDLKSFDELGSKRDGFLNHRHDQSCLSVLFDYAKVPLLPYGVIAAKKHVTEQTYIQYGD